MAHFNTNRVLCRAGARELTAKESEFVYGAANYQTLVCTVAAFNVKTSTHTGPGDGDGCGDTDSDNS
jgi:hypothetical protein